MSPNIGSSLVTCYTLLPKTPLLPHLPHWTILPQTLICQCHTRRRRPILLPLSTRPNATSRLIPPTLVRFPNLTTFCATCNRKHNVLNSSMRTLHWSAITAVLSTVCFGKINAKFVFALTASHFCLKMGVPVNMGLSRLGLFACFTSLQDVRSNFGGRFQLGVPATRVSRSAFLQLSTLTLGF